MTTLNNFLAQAYPLPSSNMNFADSSTFPGEHDPQNHYYGYSSFEKSGEDADFLAVPPSSLVRQTLNDWELSPFLNESPFGDLFELNIEKYTTESTPVSLSSPPSDDDDEESHGTATALPPQQQPQQQQPLLVSQTLQQLPLASPPEHPLPQQLPLVSPLQLPAHTLACYNSQTLATGATTMRIVQSQQQQHLCHEFNSFSAAPAGQLAVPETVRKSGALLAPQGNRCHGLLAMQNSSSCSNGLLTLQNSSNSSNNRLVHQERHSQDKNNRLVHQQQQEQSSGEERDDSVGSGVKNYKQRQPTKQEQQRSPRSEAHAQRSPHAQQSPHSEVHEQRSPHHSTKKSLKVAAAAAPACSAGEQYECCISDCGNQVTNRLRFSLRCHKVDELKTEFLNRGWNKVCHYHYFSDLYRYKKNLARNGKDTKVKAPTKKTSNGKKSSTAAKKRGRQDAELASFIVDDFEPLQHSSPVDQMDMRKSEKGKNMRNSKKKKLESTL